MFQIFVVIGTEITSVLLICQQNSIQDVLLNFAALAIILDTDSIYTDCVENFKIKKLLGDPDGFPVCRNFQFNLVFRKESCSVKFGLIVYRVLNFIYQVLYYFFLPFLAIILTYYIGAEPEPSDVQQFVNCCVAAEKCAGLQS